MYEFEDGRRHEAGRRGTGGERQRRLGGVLDERRRRGGRPPDEGGDEERGREAEPAADERRVEPVAPRGEALLERGQRTAEAPRRLVPRRPLEVAQHERGAEPFRQREQLLVEYREELAPGDLGERFGRNGCGGNALAARPSGRGPPRPHREQVRHAVQPPGDRRPPAPRRRLLRENQERRLAHVLGFVSVAEDAPTGGEDHWGVPADERLERRLVAPLGEPAQEFAI